MGLTSENDTDIISLLCRFIFKFQQDKFMDKTVNSRDFIEGWLNHIQVYYEIDIRLNSTVTLDFFVRDLDLGIFIINWEKPISVQIANKAIQLEREFNLRQLYLVSRQISQPAELTLGKFGKNVVPIHPNGLSELAISLANLVQLSPIKVHAKASS